MLFLTDAQEAVLLKAMCSIPLSPLEMAAFTALGADLVDRKHTREHFDRLTASRTPSNHEA